MGPEEIPGARGAWAPDISFFNGKYHLYYALSTFGSRNSAIGLATNATLDAADPNYTWTDQGMVLRSFQDKDDWNAIDANLVVENENSVWLNWGSFWGGIKMTPAATPIPASPPINTPHSTRSAAARASNPSAVPWKRRSSCRHDDWWYPFVSYDRCCRGANSTYNVVVGRARQITGPYVDKEGKPLTEGGGTQVIAATTPNWRGPGHQAILQEPGPGLPGLSRVSRTTGRSSSADLHDVWEDGWPRVGTLPDRTIFRKDHA